jgi:hypothetical protein
VAKQHIAPVIRYAPLGELKVYLITEAELDELERGSPASIHLNFSLLFVGATVSLLTALLTTTAPSTRAFIVLVALLIGCAIGAIIFGVLWLIHHRSSGSLGKQIRGRMPPPTAVQETASVVPTSPQLPAGENRAP